MQRKGTGVIAQEYIGIPTQTNGATDAHWGVIHAGDNAPKNVWVVSGSVDDVLSV